MQSEWNFDLASEPKAYNMKNHKRYLTSDNKRSHVRWERNHGRLEKSSSMSNIRRSICRAWCCCRWRLHYQNGRIDVNWNLHKLQAKNTMNERSGSFENAHPSELWNISNAQIAHGTTKNKSDSPAIEFLWRATISSNMRFMTSL